MYKYPASRRVGMNNFRILVLFAAALFLSAFQILVSLNIRMNIYCQDDCIDLHLERSFDFQNVTIEVNNLSSWKIKTQKMVILAGPHKAASSTLQMNMVNFFHNPENRKHKEFQDWVWAFPKGVTSYTNSKKFSLLINAIHLLDEPGCHRHIAVAKSLQESLTDFTCPQIVNKYIRKFRQVWRDGKNIIWGQEDLDRSKNLLSEILNLMSWVYRDNILVIVVIRLPHIGHLNSMLHEVNKVLYTKSKRCLSLPEMILQNEATFVNNGAETIFQSNSLGQIQRYLELGVNVAAIDLNGVKERGYELSKVVACDILDVPCLRNKTFARNDLAELVENTRSEIYEEACQSDLVDTSSKERNDAAEEILRRRDCSYMQIWDHPKFSLLYSSALLRETIGFCTQTNEENSLNHLETVSRLKYLYAM